MRLYSDTETDGFLTAVTTIHCIVNKDIDTGQVYRFHNEPTLPREGTIEEGLEQLAQAEMFVFHNGIKFDRRVINKLYPHVVLKGIERDTLVLTRLIFPDIKKHDLTLVKKRKFPAQFVGKYSLEAWGNRLGNYKGDFKGPWDTFTLDMLEYCVQDVEVGCLLFKKCEAKGYSAEAIQLEHEVASILTLQEDHGFQFNEAKAAAFYATLLTKRDELADKLREFFQGWFISKGEVLPKVSSKKFGFTKDIPYTKVEFIEFNPGSRDHIANRLQLLYGWKPEAFTKEGKPQVDEASLEHLTYPPIPLLKEYLMVEKRISQLAEGKQAWMKVSKNGRIHGGVNPQGTVTRRMSHMGPNVSQVPACDAPYGPECRELFEASEGRVLVGIDASGVQLRCLSHYLANWDNGAYALVVTTGDVHATNLEAGKPYLKSRPMAKTFIYAILFGAGDGKIGKIIEQGPRAGKALRTLFGQKIVGFDKLINALAARAKVGYLLALDGGRVVLRSAHAALAALLQAAEAVVMKKALVLTYQRLTAAGYIHGRDYSFVANVHDEFQIETFPHLAEIVGTTAVQAIVDAGVHFKFRCPLNGEFKVGANWKETH